MGLEVLGWDIGNARFLGSGKFDLECIHYVARDLVLDREDVSQITVVPISPKVRAVCSVNQLRIDPDPVANPTDRALQDRPYPEFPPDRAHVEALALVSKTRIASDH